MIYTTEMIDVLKIVYFRVQFIFVSTSVIVNTEKQINATQT